MPMPQFDLVTATARENLCRLLAACYYEPVQEFAEERVFEAMRDAAARLDPDLAASADRLAGAFAAAPLDELLLDYTRLFLGPNQILAKPYGSVWLSGESTLMQETTVAVLELYREGGFDLDEGFRELPDHIAAELEFLYLLTFRENRARHDDDGDALAATCALRKRFLDQHLGVWIAPFTAAMKDGARTDFYRELAAFTARYVDLVSRDG
jgi:TorA maturation chaperone TorD